MSRWRAAGIHLGVSAAIAAVVLVLIFMIWYPAPYLTAMGGDQLAYLVVGVDVVIGPLITLIIFKAGKKGLKFDLATIAFLQAGALAYGVMITAGARPVYSVFVVDRFETVAANELDPAELAKVKRAEFKAVPWSGPLVAGVVKPADAEESNRILFSMGEGRDLQHFPQHFVPYEDVAAEVGRRAQPIADLRRQNAERSREIDGFVRRIGLNESEAGFVPLRAKRGERAVIVRKNGEILGFLDVTPWGN